jgi:phosphoglycerate kinase
MFFFTKITAVLQSLRDLVIVGDNDLVITNMNKPACLFFGWTEDEVKGKSISFLLPTHPIDVLENAHTLVARHKNSTEFPVVIQTTRDPQASIVAWTVLPVVLPPVFEFGFHPSFANSIQPKLGIDDINFKNRRVFLRVDFNVPVDKHTGKITDDNRIQATLPTIRKIVNDGGKLIIGSHLGRPKKADPLKSLKPIAARLGELVSNKVEFAPNALNAMPQVSRMRNGDILVLENLRFYPGEDAKDMRERLKMAEVLASYGDIFVCDAFGTAHRDTASMTGVPRLMGAGVAGYLIEKEIRALSRVMRNPVQPVLAVVGGAKVSDKINLLGNLFNMAQTVIIGGAMAFTFLEAEGRSVGSSKVERVAKTKGKEIDLHAVAKDLLQKARSSNVRILLPVDHCCAKSFKDEEILITKTADIPDGYMGLDIGPKTIELFKKTIQESRTCVWNGPMGVFEIPKFSQGSTAVAEAIATTKGMLSIVGGGETAACAQNFKAGITHISTGGGATLELLEGKALPGLITLTSKAAAKL